MSSALEAAPSGSEAPRPVGDDGPEVLRRADGVCLIGDTAGSGYRVPPALARRADGQVVQLSPLLYAVLGAIDGERDPDQVAAVVSERTGRGVSADNVRTLVDSRLRPMGLLTRPDGSEPALRRSQPLLGLRLRYVVSDPDRTRRLTAPFAVLFRPLLAVPVLLAFAAICWWLFFRQGLAQATYEAFQSPGLLLLVVAVTILSAGFHEFGHAAAARYGGSTPGAMGVGLYLVWPAFYTDVTDSYRLGRWGRVRTDLGGLYFNAIVAVAIVGVWWATGHEALLLVVATQVLQMLRQLIPLVRFDGYHVLADLTGVPDLFHRIKPTLLSALPGRRTDPEAALLKPWARRVVTLWVVVVVPVLVLTLVMMVVVLPRIVGTAWARLQEHRQVLDRTWEAGDQVAAASVVVAILATALPVAAVVYLLLRLGRQTGTWAWRTTRGRPVARGLAVLLAAALGAALTWAWWPDPDTYRPISPDERGTLVDLAQEGPAAPVPALARPGAAADAPAAAESTLRAGDDGVVRTVWDGDRAVPKRSAPALAVVLVPRGEQSSADGWVFPFDEPLAPGPGDNQALAVNTTDGTVVYDVAVALVWVEGEPGTEVQNRNEAYAFASCKSCAAVAVAFQVVLVIGDSGGVAPENLAGAVNHDCVNCLTYALATQLFVSLDGPLSDDARAQVEAIWAQIAAFAEEIASVPLDEIDDRLAEWEAQILEVIEADQPGTIPLPPSPGATEDASNDSPDAPSPADSPAPSSAPTSDASAPSSEPDETASSAPPEPTQSSSPVDGPAPSSTP